MSVRELPHPSDFQTSIEPQLNATEGRVEYTFNELVARVRDEFLFVDYLFESRTSRLAGAVGTIMRPVTKPEFERRKEKVLDYSESHFAPVYDQENIEMSWETWIQGRLAAEGPRLFLDQSYAGKYSDAVRENSEVDNIEAVECLGGGRIFQTPPDIDEVFDDELLRLVNQAENSGVTQLYSA